MLVQFKSPATETITMFGNDATQLLKLMGATGRIPGGLSAEDVPPAMRQLESAVEDMKAKTTDTDAPPADNEDSASDEEPHARRAPIALETRAIPLLSLLKRAAAAHAGVTWESG